MLHQEHHTLHNSSTENDSMQESPRKIAPRLGPAATPSTGNPHRHNRAGERKKKSEAPKPIPSMQASP